jgi:hypothetical protein
MLGDEAKCRSLSQENPLTGKPDAEIRLSGLEEGGWSSALPNLSAGEDASRYEKQKIKKPHPFECG